MRNNVICEDCAHSGVCKYQAEFAEMQKQFNNFKVNIDTVKQLTIGSIKSFDYMRDRCKELERDNMLKEDHILELETEIERLRAAAKDSAEKIEVLNDSIEVPRLKCSNFLDRVYTSKRSI